MKSSEEIFPDLPEAIEPTIWRRKPTKIRGTNTWFPVQFPWERVLSFGNLLKIVICSGFTHWNWWFSIVMFVYQRVTDFSEIICALQSVNYGDTVMNLRRQETLKEWGERQQTSSEKLFGFLHKRRMWWIIHGAIESIDSFGPPNISLFSCRFQQYPYPRLVGDVPNIQLYK